MAAFSLCSVSDCGKPPAKGRRGYCYAHYKRWWRYGDPLGGGTPHGAAARFLREVVLTYNGDECLIWPFSRNEFGYAQISHFNGKRMSKVCRIVCRAAHGPAPSPKLDTAHSCGNGHLGCVAKGHLSWKTRKANMADKLIHDTHNRGERCPSAKLTEQDVRQIRSLKGKLCQREIAEQFGVSKRAISLIHAGKNWAWLV